MATAYKQHATVFQIRRHLIRQLAANAVQLHPFPKPVQMFMDASHGLFLGTRKFYHSMLLVPYITDRLCQKSLQLRT